MTLKQFLALTAAQIKGMTVEEIEEALKAVKAALEESPDTDAKTLEDVNKQMDAIEGARAAANTGAEHRKLLERIASGAIGTEVRTFHADGSHSGTLSLTAGTPAAPATDDPLATDEYRRAFYKTMTGKNLSEPERRAFTAGTETRAGMTSAAASAGPAIPTQLNEKIVQKVKRIAPLLDKITLTRINGNVKLTVEGDVAEANKHTENSNITADGDTLISVTLTGYEITKLVSISRTVQSMTQGGFEDWLTEMLAKRVAKRIVRYIVKGTGSSEPTGVEKAATWGAENSITVPKANSLTAAQVLELVGMLPEDYDAEAIWLMSKKTLFADFKPLQDKNKNDIIVKDGKTYYVEGYEVMLCQDVAMHEAYLGDFGEIYGNLAQDITVESNAASGFRQNAIDFLGMAIFDCKPAVPEAFVKLAKGTA